LSAVFLLAGLAKLADPKSASKAFIEFGLPRVPAHLVSLLLPLAEITVAVALIPLASVWYGACAALALLGIFVIGIAVNLARGRKPDCQCFGQLQSSPIGWKTLLRNGVLGAVAGWLVFRGPLRDGPSLWSHLATAGENERRFFIFAAFVLCFMLFRAMRRRPVAEPESSFEWDWDEDDADGSPVPAEHRLVQPRTSRTRPAPSTPRVRAIELAVGAAAPEFAVPSTKGEKCSLQTLRDEGKTVCLVFSSPHCEPCRALWPYLGRWAREHADSLNIVVISRGSAAATLAKQNGFDPARVLLQREFELSDLYGVTSTPAAVLVGADGVIQSRLAVGREDIGRLIPRNSGIGINT
jgi:thiol-disulfide isomerase/thioredoxin